jgi:hypothetical protein
MAVNIVTRQTGSYAKNSTLTNTELDTNFINLKDAVDNVNVNIENTKSSIRPSLLLDFANLKRLDKRITFTRASIGTRYNADGLLERVEAGKPRFDHDPVTKESLGLLIEEQRTNLLVYTENFNYATGVYSPMLLSHNVDIAPDGSRTACKASTSNSGSFYKEFIGASGLGTYTLSIYINTKSTCTFASFAGFFTGASLQGFFVSINPSTGGIIDYSGTTSTPTSTPVGNGWYRFTLTATGINSGNNRVIWQLYSNIATQNDIIFWGAQLEEGAFATSYIPSNDTFTSRASTATYIGSDGLVKTSAINTARYNYNPMNLKLAPKLLLEPAATNLVTYSEQFDNAVWENAGGNLGIAVTANNTTSPDGNTTADKITNDGGGTSLFQYTLAVPASNITDYTASIFVKAGTATTFVFNMYYIGNTEDNLVFNLSTGTYIGGDTGRNQPSIIPVGNGWYRISYVITRDATNSRTSILFRGWGINGVIRGSGVIGEYYYVWGAQLEVGTTATSYIPTTSSQVTRSADASSSGQYTRAVDGAVMTDLKWYRQDEGTLHATSRLMSTTTAVSVPTMAWVDRGAGGAGSFISLRYVSGSGSATIDSYGFDNSVSQWDFNGTAVTSQTVISCALAYATNDIALSVSGSTTETDTSAAVGQGMRRMLIGPSQNLHILKLSYYPKRLSNAELQSLTGG